MLSVEWNIQKVNAAAVWALGYTGQGVVIGGQDTGYDWDHPALINQYRGWNGTLGTSVHDYNWHDAIHSGGGSCGANSPAPCDDYSHGTHTMGIAVGDDGGSNQIGVAPGARWIGCRNMDQGVGTPATYLECFEFFLAPYPVGGDPSQGQPDLAPDVTNNSWGCPVSEGCSWSTLQAAVEAQRAAGILTVSSAGNDGPSCSSVRDPAGLYDAAYTVGSTDNNDAIASDSSRGPVTVDGSGRRKPDISAPGVSVRSSLPGTGYGYKSGTSMAAPHVAGAAALLWSAQPALRGQLDQTEQILNSTALPRYNTQCGDPPDTVPNNVYGWGRLDALAAVQRALALGTGRLEGVVSDDALTAVQSAATQAITNTVTFTASTDASGHYSMTVLADTYTVAAWKYGYAPQVITNVLVADLAAVQVNLVLSRTAPCFLSGCITDSLTGDPLTASITVIDPLGRPLTETQASDCYSLTLYGSPYTLTAQARLHQPATAFVYLVDDTVHNWSLVPSTADGIIWGHVTNQETGAPVDRAAIQASPGLTSTQSGADGYYELQLPPGPYTITVSAPLYAAQTDAYVVVPQGNLIQRDYALPASRLALLPSEGISVTLQLGTQLVRSLTISNAGSQELTFDISSLDLPWLSASPTSGTLGAAAAAPVSLTFDAAAVVEDGIYTGPMRLDSNDPQAQPYAGYALTMTVFVLPPKLSLHKTASSDRVEAGTLLTYTITVTNSGGPASSLVISDTLPEHTLLAHGGSLVLNDVLWSDLSAPFSSTLSVSLAVTVTCVPSGTPIVNNAYQVTASEWPTPTRGQALSVTATHEGVVAAFSIGTLERCDLGAPVVARNYPTYFNNLSQNATSYTWAFGDGFFSHAIHPIHTYETSGPHTVVLTASNLCDSATYSQTLTVYEQALTLHPTSAAQEADAGQALTYTLQLTNSGDVSDTYCLSRLSGRWPIILTPSETFTLAAGDSQELSVRISIPFTAAINAQDVSTILASAGSGPSASAVLSTSVTCVDVSGVGIAHTPLSASLLMTFSGSALAGSPPLTYTWDFYGSRVGNGPLITHTFPRSATAQTYTVTLTVANACPSTQETQTFITIQPYSFYLPIIMRQLPKEIIACPIPYAQPAEPGPFYPWQSY